MPQNTTNYTYLHAIVSVQEKADDINGIMGLGNNKAEITIYQQKCDASGVLLLLQVAILSFIVWLWLYLRTKINVTFHNR